MISDINGARLRIFSLRELAERERQWAAQCQRLAQSKIREADRTFYEDTAARAISSAEASECRADALDAWLNARLRGRDATGTMEASAGDTVTSLAAAGA